MIAPLTTLPELELVTVPEIVPEVIVGSLKVEAVKSHWEPVVKLRYPELAPVEAAAK
jgi:hypothetical protein